MVALQWCYAGMVLAGPDHPVITEVYPDPPGLNDGPVGRTPGNLHQEFIEIYLPTLADLDPALNKDSLDLTVYDVEGDFTSPERGLINYRIDLPTFDLDPSNGLTGLARPASGTVVLGWVDYVGSPPTGLAGTPATRVALVNGGVTAASDFTFIAINGNEFTGTTNFPTPVAFSHLTAAKRSGGFIDNGSSAFLLVDRDSAGFVSLAAADDPGLVPPVSNADPSLPAGTVLSPSSLLDAFAANDDSVFSVALQPYVTPTGQSIDLETVLPAGGAFSRLVPQLAESLDGYSLLLADIGKTTDDASAANDDPALDAVSAYRPNADGGPLRPSPGFVPLASSPAQLAVADDASHNYSVLAGTTAAMGIIAANAGGAYWLFADATPGTPSVPGVISVETGLGALTQILQGAVFPKVNVTPLSGAPHGAITTLPVTVRGQRALFSDPAVIDSLQTVTVTLSVLNPTTGLDENLAPFQATTIVAVQGMPAPATGTNEFLPTSLGQFVATHLGGAVRDDRGNGAALVDPATNLGDPAVIDAMEQGMPDSPAAYINPVSAAGTGDLLTTVLNSPETLRGHDTYLDGTIDPAFTGVRAIELGIPDVKTSGGVFVPSEPVHYADPGGRVGFEGSALTNATAGRGFELALIDSNLLPSGALETGRTDDFGLVMEVGTVRSGATVLPGEFVFMSMAGGLAGADIDGLSVPPFNTRTNIIFIDLDLLDTLMGVESVSRLWIVDSEGGGSINLLEAFVLNPTGPPVPAFGVAGWLVGLGLLGSAGALGARLRAARRS